ncbi:ATPase [Candidatus Magnetomorum sp. HK-1]|nr:ATPase [Candidatus Magnetomorum sp. HK-1]
MKIIMKIYKDLKYVRDRNKREVDFLLVKDRKPWILVETKLGQTKESKNLLYFANKLGVQHRYQVTTKNVHTRHVIPCWSFFSELP